MLINYYVYISTALFLMLAVAWRRSDLLNFVIKIVFIASFGAGAFLSFCTLLVTLVLVK